MDEFNPTPPEFPFAGTAEWGADEIGPWQTLVYDDISYRFRWIPPGRFWMGSPAGEAERFDNEDRHLVTLTKGFWLGETTVTQALWRTVMGENPIDFEDDNLPVETVDWNMAWEFIQRLIEVADSPDLCLPTEAQWEYACRAGTETPFSFGDLINTDQVNFARNIPNRGELKGEFRGKTVPVGSLPPNPWGLYEMHGNVDEWCQDAWREHLGVDPVEDPLMRPETAGAHRVVRGGSWINFCANVRSAFRARLAPHEFYDPLGFRLARG